MSHRVVPSSHIRSIAEHSQALEGDVTRQELQHQVLHIPEHPQLIIRIGWPTTAAAELPPTPRRDLRFVLLPFS